MTTTTLSPDEWKQLCVLNAAQLQNYLNGIPAMTENGASGLTDQHLALIEGHLNRGGAFLQAWRRAKAAGSVAGAAEMRTDAPQSEPAPAPETNGAAPAKRKGGWPKGRSRTRQAKSRPDTPDAVTQ